jgi:hypothetical protein
MSIPIISWFGLVMLFPLLQPLLILSAVALATIDVLSGRGSSWLVIIPIGYVGLFVTQWGGGRYYLNWLQRRNRAFVAVAIDDRMVLCEENDASSHFGTQLFQNGDVGVVQTRPLGRQKRFSKATDMYRLRETAIAETRLLIEKLGSSHFYSEADRLIAEEPLLTGKEKPITVRLVKHRAPLWFVTGYRKMLEIDDGVRRQRFVGGSAAVIGHIPIFTMFHWTAIFGGRSQWVAGFYRHKPVEIGPTDFAGLIQMAFPLRTAGRESFADGEKIVEALQSRISARLDKEASERLEAGELLDRLLSYVSAEKEESLSWQLLQRNSDLADGHGEALCARMAQAKADGDEDIIYTCAVLIADLAQEEFCGLSKSLLSLLDSKELAFRLVDGDPKAMTPEQLRSAVRRGYSLVRYVPMLYTRLGEFGEDARKLIDGLGNLGNWPEPLRIAKEGLNSGGSVELKLRAERLTSKRHEVRKKK